MRNAKSLAKEGLLEEHYGKPVKVFKEKKIHLIEPSQKGWVKMMTCCRDWLRVEQKDLTKLKIWEINQSNLCPNCLTANLERTGRQPKNPEARHLIKFGYSPRHWILIEESQKALKNPKLKESQKAELLSQIERELNRDQNSQTYTKLKKQLMKKKTKSSNISLELAIETYFTNPNKASKEYIEALYLPVTGETKELKKHKHFIIQEATKIYIKKLKETNNFDLGEQAAKAAFKKLNQTTLTDRSQLTVYLPSQNKKIFKELDRQWNHLLNQEQNRLLKTWSAAIKQIQKNQNKTIQSVVISGNQSVKITLLYNYVKDYKTSETKYYMTANMPKYIVDYLAEKWALSGRKKILVMTTKETKETLETLTGLFEENPKNLKELEHNLKLTKAAIYMQPNQEHTQ